jgi:hypothetical protein
MDHELDSAAQYATSDAPRCDHVNRWDANTYGQ